MTLEDAKQIIANYNKTCNHTEDDDFVYEEALFFHIYHWRSYLLNLKVPPDKSEINNAFYLLAGHYFRLEEYELSQTCLRRIYHSDKTAISCLGDFSYYGLLHQVPNYKSAYEYYEQSKSILHSKIKLADMYKYGQYVKQDDSMYVERIIELARAYGKRINQFPELLRRVGEINASIEYLQKAKEGFIQQLKRPHHFMHIHEMRDTIFALYELTELDPMHFDLYDCFYLLKEPHRVSFIYENQKHELESARKTNRMVYRMDDQWYFSFEQLLLKTKVNHCYLPGVYNQLKEFKLL